MARNEIIAGNWKMHKTQDEALQLALSVVSGLGEEYPRDVVLCPPFTALAGVSRALAGASVALGAQNVHWEGSGAYTGEISALMLADLGCRYVIVGHSERRALFGETDEDVARKLGAVAAGGMIPILCVGETLDQRRGGDTEAVVAGQLEGALSAWESRGGKDLVIAYEPVWAIGTGVTATPEQAQDVHHLVRGFLARTFGPEVAEATSILYGGSVKPGNAAELLAQGDIDGALVGGASLDTESFLGICVA
jgi:triosephosphate isomerase